jgi:hypothetical protein
MGQIGILRAIPWKDFPSFDNRELEEYLCWFGIRFADGIFNFSQWNPQTFLFTATSILDRRGSKSLFLFC